MDPMGDEPLNLGLHGPSDVPGKAIKMGGATYVIGRQVAEREGGPVFALLNARTGLSLFLAEIFWTNKHPPAEKQRRLDHRITLFSLEDVEPMPPYTECHETEGGLITLEQNRNCAFEPDFHHQPMRTAEESAKRWEWDVAKSLYWEILDKNPQHTVAIKGLVMCPRTLDETGKMLKLLDQGIATEPNDAELYREKAQLFCELGWPNGGAQALDQTLKRYRWDGRSWTQKAKILHRFGVVSGLEPMRADLLALQSSVANAARFDRRLAELDEQTDDAAAVEGAIHAVKELQQKKDWTAALAKWERIGCDRLGAFDQLNVAICRFQLGQWEQVAGEAVRLSWCLAIAELAHRAATAMAFIASHRAGDQKTALSLMSYLAELKGMPLDMPGSPTIVYSENESVMEDASSGVILGTIYALKPFCLTQNQIRANARLTDLYLQREQQMAKPRPATPECPKPPPKPWWKVW